MANSRSTMHFHGLDLVSIYHDIDKVANVNPHNLNEQNKPDEELEAELPIIDGTSKFRKKHVLIGIAEEDEDFEVISNILKKLENRDNKVNPTNKESKKLINIVRRRNDYDWGRGRNQRNTFFLAMNWIPYDTQGKGSIDQTLDEIWDTTTGNMKIFENGLWIIPENEFNIIDIDV